MVVGIGLVLAGTWVILCNWLCLVFNLRNQRRQIARHYSFAPLLGPALVIPGLMFFVGFRIWTLAILLVDFGTLVLVASLPTLAREFRRR